MYTEWFGLTEHPFELHTDARFLYLSPAHARTQAFLTYAVLKRDGIVVITGDIGAGKSTMIEDLRKNVDPRYRLLVLHQTQLDDLELLKLFLLELGVRETTSGKAQTLGRIRRSLIEGFDRGEKALLVVDDAQNLSVEAIEELRMLADDECDGQRLLGLVLIGQPSLRQTLASENLSQVRQRVRLHYHLNALAPDQVRAYVAHRLSVAGAGRDDIFDADALELIALYSQGLPRLINMLCDMSLTGCALKKCRTVSVRSVSEALDELGWSRPELAGGIRSGLGHRALLGVASVFARVRNAGDTNHKWAEGSQRSPAALARLGAHRQMQAWQRQAAGIRRRLVAVITTVQASTRRVLADAQVAAERAARTPAGGGLMSDLTWGIGGLYLARRSIVTTLAVASCGLLFALRFGASSDAAQSISVTPPAAMDAPTVPVAAAVSPDEGAVVQNGNASEAAPIETVLRVTSSLVEPQSQLADDVMDILPNTNLPIRNADWLLAQPSQGYTIQIIGAHNTENLARFVRRNGLGNELAYYTMERNGEAFYLLLHGVYADAPAAVAARSAMPSGVLAGKPWIRSFQDIHSAIRDARAMRRVVLIDEPSATTR